MTTVAHPTSAPLLPLYLATFPLCGKKQGIVEKSVGKEEGVWRQELTMLGNLYSFIL
jgi:hypothetical protein